MRKILYLLTVSGVFLLTSCLDTIQEITLNEDGTGIVSNSNDMGALIAMAKQLGGADEMAKAGDQKIDSVISLAEVADSIASLSPEEREMVRKGTLRLNIHIADDKFVTHIAFPFSKPSEIVAYNTLSGKVLNEAMKNEVDKKGGAAPGMDEMPEPSSFDDYYKYDFSKGELTKKLDENKYKGVESDEYLKGVKEAAMMGLKMKATYIINLPRPAEKVAGKGAKLSEDGKQVTIVADIEDFFEDPTLLEFKIKY